MLEIASIGSTDYCRSELFLSLGRTLLELKFHEFGGHLIDLAVKSHPSSEFERLLISELSNDANLHRSLFDVALQIPDSSQRNQQLSEVGYRAAKNGLAELSRECLDSITDQRYANPIWLGLANYFAANHETDSLLHYARLGLDAIDVRISSRRPWHSTLELISICAANSDTVAVKSLLQIIGKSVSNKPFVTLDGGLMARFAGYGLDLGAVREVCEFGLDLPCECDDCCGIVHYKIVHRLTASAHFEEAYDYIMALEDCEARACLAVELASKFLANDNYRDSIPNLLVIARSFAQSDTLSATGVEILLEVADIEMQTSGAKTLKANFRTAYSAAMKIPAQDDDEYERQNALRSLTVFALANGLEKDAEPILEQLEYVHPRASIFQDAAHTSAKRGNSERTFRYVNRALDTHTRVESLLNIARLNTIPSAIDSALKQINTISKDSVKISFSLEAITVLDSCGRRDEATKLLNATMTLVERLSISELRAAYFANLSRRYRTLGQTNQADSCLEKCKSDVYALADRQTKVTLPYRLIDDLLESGRKTDALLLAQQATSYYHCSDNITIQVVAKFAQAAEWERCLDAIQQMDRSADRNRALAILAGFYAAYHPYLENSDCNFLAEIVQAAIK